MADIGTAYVQIEPTAKGISKKIEGEMSAAGESSGGAFSSGFGKVLGGIGKVAIGAVGAAATAVGGIVASSVKNFGEYEQLAGGVEKIFDEANIAQIIKDANNAYKELNMSANDYLAAVNQTGASFAQTMGDQKGYDTARMGMKAIADYASGTGRNLDELNGKYALITRSTSSYQSIADQFSGILPATSVDFLEQAQAAGILSKSYSKLTEVPIAEYQEAVTQMLEKGVAAMGLTNNTANEAEGTLTGSIATVQAAWENLVTSFANPEADLGAFIDDLFEAVGNTVRNIMPVVQQALGGVSKLITALGPEIAAAIPDLITEFLPGLLSAGVSVVETLSQGILQALPQLTPCVMDIINSLLNLILQLAPQLISAGLDIILQLANGITQAIPTLTPTLNNVLLEIVTMLTDPGMLTSLIQAGVDMILALTDGLLKATPQIIEALPTIIQNICDALISALPLLIDAAIQLVNLIVQNMPAIMAAMNEAAPQIIESFSEALIASGPILAQAAPELIKALINGYMMEGSLIINAGINIVKYVVSGLKQAANFVIEEGSNLIKKLKEKILEVGKNLIGAGSELITRIKEGLKNAEGNLFQKGIEITNTLKNKIIEKVKGFVDVGKKIVESIKEGLAQAWESVVEWFKEKVEKLKKSIGNLKDLVSGDSKDSDTSSESVMSSAINAVRNTAASEYASGYTAANYQPAQSNNEILDLLKNTLPDIASGKTITLKFDVDGGRLFRLMQIEESRNTELVGV